MSTVMDTHTSRIGGILFAWVAERNDSPDTDDITGLTTSQQETAQLLHVALDRLFGAPSDGVRHEVRHTAHETTIIYVWPNYSRWSNARYGIRAELGADGALLEENLVYIAGDETTWYEKREAVIAHHHEDCYDEHDEEPPTVVEHWVPVHL